MSSKLTISIEHGRSDQQEVMHSSLDTSIVPTLRDGDSSAKMQPPYRIKSLGKRRFIRKKEEEEENRREINFIRDVMMSDERYLIAHDPKTTSKPKRNKNLEH